MSEEKEEETFLYFAYGSNMLTQRIRINNPSARFMINILKCNSHISFLSMILRRSFLSTKISRFQSLGRLHHHRLDFNHKSKVDRSRIQRHHHHHHLRWIHHEAKSYWSSSEVRLNLKKIHQEVKDITTIIIRSGEALLRQ